MRPAPAPLGSAIAFFVGRTNYRFLSVATGFPAGVMLYVSLVEILPKGAESLGVSNGEANGNWWATGAFFAGIVLILLIDRLITSAENSHAVRTGGQIDAAPEGTSPTFALSASYELAVWNERRFTVRAFHA